MRRRVAAGVFWLLAWGAIPATAQGLSFVPSFGMSARYDDNVYHRPDAEADLNVRFSPRLDALYTSERLAVTGRYGLDADRFTRHPELTTAHGRQEASLDARYNRSRRFLIAAGAAFTETQTPSDLNDVTALTPGRARARRVALRSSATYNLGPRTGATVGYTAALDTLRGGVSLTTQNATSALDHRLSDGDSVRVAYLEQHFQFGGGETRASRAFTAEWTREVHRGTTLTFRAGPRLTDGVLAPEMAASVGRRGRAGELSMSYLHTQTTLIGLPGIAATSSVTATAGAEVRPRVRLRAGSGLLRTRQGGLSSFVYRVSAACAWTLASQVAIEAGYETELQRGDFYTARATQNIRRNLATVNLVVLQRAALAAR